MSNNVMTTEIFDQTESYIDVTDVVEVYEHGKTIDCECGHGIGVELRQESVKCASCGTVLVDRRHNEREEQAKEIRDKSKGQTTLGQFT